MHRIEDPMALMMKLTLGDHLFDQEPSPRCPNLKKFRGSQEETKGIYQLGYGLNDEEEHEGQTQLNETRITPE
jgi:hypothetical protein